MVDLFAVTEIKVLWLTLCLKIRGLGSVSDDLVNANTLQC